MYLSHSVVVDGLNLTRMKKVGSRLCMKGYLIYVIGAAISHMMTRTVVYGEGVVEHNHQATNSLVRGCLLANIIQ